MKKYLIVYFKDCKLRRKKGDIWTVSKIVDEILCEKNSYLVKILGYDEDYEDSVKINKTT